MINYHDNSHSEKEARRETRREAKRNVILEAALKAYGIYGLTGIKVKDIAKIAGIGKSTIYEYFKSKDDIEKAAINKFLFKHFSSSNNTELFEMIDEDPVLVLIDMLDAMIELPIKNPEIYTFYIQLMIKCTQKGKKVFKKDMEKIFKSVMVPMKYIFKKGIEKGLMNKNIDIDNFSMLIGIILDGVGFYSMIFNDKKVAKVLGQDIKELILEKLGIDFNKIKNKENKAE